MVTEFQIAGRTIGANQPCFIIAEAGVNHNGDLKLAHQLIDVAMKSGADAIKFQTFKAERLATTAAPKAAYQLAATDADESEFEMLHRLELDADAHRALIAHCQEKHMLFLSTPFDEMSADLLETLGVPAFKTPSGEITNLPYLAHLAHKGKPMIVSTGMAFLGEVETAVRTIEEAGNHKFALLQCVSNYPANPADINLRAMQTMWQAFNVPVGYSDHSLGIEVALAAVALGACIVEKHFTLNRNLPGPDHQSSAEPTELTALVRGIRIVEAALGNGRKQPAASEANTAAVARKSLHIREDLPSGHSLAFCDVLALRPGTGISPANLDKVIGRKLNKSMRSGTILKEEDLD